MLSFFICVFVLWAMSVELDMQLLNKTIESGGQIIYVKFYVHTFYLVDILKALSRLSQFWDNTLIKYL
jgi:hypothetical protein